MDNADGLIAGGSGSNRPLFQFTGFSLNADAIPSGQLTLSGPSEQLDPAHCPVRGDLAHIALAGRVFVPHYAVPMPQRLLTAAQLHKAGRADADVVAALPGGVIFDMLDIAGGWAWGQVSDGEAADIAGLVGYLPVDVLAQEAAGQ